MLGNSKKIIYIKKGTFSAFKANSAKSTFILNETEMTDANVKLFFETLKKSRTKAIRLLFSDDTSYNLQIEETELKNKKNGEKQAIFDIASKRIPDEVAIEEITYIKKNEIYLVFAPIKIFYNLFVKYANEYSINIEVLESEMIAKHSNPDPLIGISLSKEKIMPTVSKMNKNVKNNVVKKSKKREILKAAAIVSVTILIIFAVLIISKIVTLDNLLSNLRILSQ